MEVIAELFVGLGAGCHTLQRQAYAHLQVLLEDSTSGPAVHWAAGPTPRGCCIDGADGAARRQQQSLPSFRRPSTSSAAWASKSLGNAPAKPDGCGPSRNVAFPTAAAFASLTVVSGGGASGASDLRAGAAAANTGRNCCGGSDREPKPHVGQQSPPEESKFQSKQAVGIRQESDGQEWRREAWNQLRGMSGTWIRNRDSSDSMEDAMNLMHLNGIVRQAVKLVRGVRIELDPDNFTFTVFSVISWFKVRERYPLSGEERNYRRRDLRRGGAQGYVEPCGEDLRVQLRWSDPFGGKGRDHFRLVSEDELHIDSVIEVGGQTARYRTVYNRKADSRHRHHGAGDHTHKQQQQQQGGANGRDGRAHVASASTDLADDGVGSEHGGHHQHHQQQHHQQQHQHQRQQHSPPDGGAGGGGKQ